MGGGGSICEDIGGTVQAIVVQIANRGTSRQALQECDL